MSFTDVGDGPKSNTPNMQMSLPLFPAGCRSARTNLAKATKGLPSQTWPFLAFHTLHLQYELETNVIPIGHIRVGSYLERAFLFKVLADRVGLPCAFVRGSYGRAWVEIAIPSININVRSGRELSKTIRAPTASPLL